VKVQLSFQLSTGADVVRRKKVLSFQAGDSVQRLYDTISGRLGTPPLWPKGFRERLDQGGAARLFYRDGSGDGETPSIPAPTSAVLRDLVHASDQGATADLLLRIVEPSEEGAEATTATGEESLLHYSRTFLHFEDNASRQELSPRALSDPGSHMRSIMCSTSHSRASSQAGDSQGLLEQAEQERQHRKTCEGYIQQKLLPHLGHGPRPCSRTRRPREEQAKGTPPNCNGLLGSDGRNCQDAGATGPPICPVRTASVDDVAADTSADLAISSEARSGLTKGARPADEACSEDKAGSGGGSPSRPSAQMPLPAAAVFAVTTPVNAAMEAGLLGDGKFERAATGTGLAAMGSLPAVVGGTMGTAVGHGCDAAVHLCDEGAESFASLAMPPQPMLVPPMAGGPRLPVPMMLALSSSHPAPRQSLALADALAPPPSLLGMNAIAAAAGPLMTAEPLLPGDGISCQPMRAPLGMPCSSMNPLMASPMGLPPATMVADTLFEMVSCNDIHGVKRLIDGSVDINTCTARGSHVLFRAVIKARELDVVHLLLRARADVRAQDERGNQVMHFWARATVGRNHLLEIGRSLLLARADINAQRTNDGMSPLHHVTVAHNNRRGWLDFHKALLLVRNGANLCSLTQLGQLPCNLISMDGRASTKKMMQLLTYGVTNSGLGGWPCCEYEGCPWCS